MKLQRIAFVASLSDVDGVMTNGEITYSSCGDELKTFHVRDGLAVKLWMRSGYPFSIITARKAILCRGDLKGLELHPFIKGKRISSPRQRRFGIGKVLSGMRFATSVMIYLIYLSSEK